MTNPTKLSSVKTPQGRYPARLSLNNVRTFPGVRYTEFLQRRWNHTSVDGHIRLNETGKTTLLQFEEGESVEITHSGKPFARLKPIQPVTARPLVMPDFLARMRQQFPHPKSGKGLSGVVDYDRGDRCGSHAKPKPAMIAHITLPKRLLASLFFFTCAANAQQPWLDSERLGNEARFLKSSEIQRYDLASRSWLDPVNLPRAGATAMAADAHGAVVAYGDSIYRYNADFTGESFVGTTSSAIHSLFLDGELVIAVHSIEHNARVTIFDRATAAQISSVERISISMHGTSHAPQTNRLYGKSQESGSRSIVSISYTDQGALGSLNRPVPVGSIPEEAQRTWVFPDETRVVNSAGTVFAAPGRTYVGNLGSSIIDIDFNGDVPIVLRNGELLAFTANLLETGMTAITTSTDSKLHVTETEAFIFTPTAASPDVEIVPLASINAPVPGAPVDPTGLAFSIDDAFLDGDGNVLVLSKSQASVFRWSPAERRYSDYLTVHEIPDYTTYSAENHRIYFTYPSGEIRAIALDDDNPQEVLFHTLPEAAIGFASAGEYIFAAATLGFARRHYMISPDGNLLDTNSVSLRSGIFEWNPAKRHMYFFGDILGLPDFLYQGIDADGRFTERGEAPYQRGQFPATGPIRVRPDGGKVAIGSGIVFETTDLTIAAYLPNGFTDAAWHGEKLLTLREAGEASHLQIWQGPQFSQVGSGREFEGTPLRLFDTSEGILVMTSVGGTPRMILLDDDFEPVFSSPIRPDAPTAPIVTGRAMDSISLQWSDPTGNAESFRVEYRIGTEPWTEGANTGAETTQTTIPALPADTDLEIRVMATAGDTLVSPPSPVVTTRTLASPDEPVGEPYNLRITRIYSNSITVEWQDNGENETGFQLMRSTDPDGPFNTITLPPGTTSHTQTRLRADETYYFQVRIVNGDVLGELSSQVSATTLSENAPPAFSGPLQVAGVSPNSVTLEWQDISSNEDGFIIERSTSPATSWTPLGTVPYNTETFTDTTAEPDTQYTYRVAAFNSAGMSDFRSRVATTPSLGGEFTGLAMRSGSVKYFAFTRPHRIERYDLEARSWLPPIPLEAAATALWVDESWIFVAQDRLVVRFSKDGAHRTLMASAQSTVEALFTIHDSLVFTNMLRVRLTMNKHSGNFLSMFEHFYGGTGHSVAPGLNRAFFRSTTISPSYIHFLEFGESGDFVAGVRSPHRSAFPSGSPTFVFPDEQRVTDTSGTVYSTDGLVFSNSLGGPFTDLAFDETHLPVILRDDVLHTYSNTLLPIGSHTLSTAGLRLAVDGDDALVFIRDSTSLNGLRVEAVDLRQINVPEPGPMIAPNGLSYSVDDAFVDRDGNLLLFSKSHLSLFRWSPAGREYTDSFPLFGMPDYAAYSVENHSAYFAYPTQIISAMDLDDPAPTEVPLHILPRPPSGFATVGEFIFAVDPSGTRNTHFVLSPQGELLDSKDWNRRSRAFAWDPVKRRIYHFRDNIYPNALIYETIDADGRITGEGEAPFVAGVEFDPPIRVSPGGDKVVIGSGTAYETEGLTRIGDNFPAFTDALWLEGSLVTIHEEGSQTRLRQWSTDTFAEQDALPTFVGAPVRILSLDDDLIALITLENEVPRIHLLDQSLAIIHIFISAPDAVENELYSWSPDFDWSTLGTGPLTIQATVLPDWLGFANGTFTGTPRSGDAGDFVDRSKSHRVVLRAANTSGDVEEREFHITAYWRNNPPSLPPSLPTIIANEEADDIQFDAGAFLTDPDGRDIHVWEILENTNPDLFAELSINDDGLLEIAFAPLASGTSTLTLEVTDASGASAQTTVEIELPPPSVPWVTVDSELILSRLTGLYEQNITVTNRSTRMIAGFELSVTGLREGVILYNGSSNGDGGGTLAYHQPMQPGESVAMVLEYFATPRGTIPTPTITVTPFEVAEPLVEQLARIEGAAPPFAVNRMEKLEDGGVVVEFNATPGERYLIHYSADAVNWTACPVPIRAGGTKVQWIDRGPPWTDSPPDTVPSRFYRVQHLEP